MNKKCQYLLILPLLFGLVFSAGCSAVRIDSIPPLSGSAQETSASGVLHQYSAEDVDDSWNAAGATKITFAAHSVSVSGRGAVSDGSLVTISDAGTYILSGSTDNGQVLVYAGKNDLVRLVLNGLDITCGDSAPIYIMKAGKTVMILASGTENTVMDATAYARADAAGEPNAAVFSKDDLTITGNGSLVVTANYEDAICSKDILTITGGNIHITAADDGLRGTDGVAILDGTFDIRAGSKGIRSTKDAETSAEDVTSETEESVEQGFVLIDGGVIHISECTEGIEAPRIEISGGTIDIEASDDAINAAGSSSAGEQFPQGGRGRPAGDWAGGERRPGETGAMPPDQQPGEWMEGDFAAGDYYLRITGGRINLFGRNDGIDANGNVYIEGGEVFISSKSMGADGAIDVDESVTITGGSLITAGSIVIPAANSTQASILVSHTAQQAQGSVIALKDATGKTILEYASRITFSASAFSSPDLKVGETYTLYIDGQKLTDITLTNLATTISDDGGAYSMTNGFGGGFGGGRNRQAEAGGRTGGQGAAPGRQAPADAIDAGKEPAQ
ncbi:MAG: carbohydrate-binding domain-containing protein [Clostridiales Family XIII bacterium]|jgi:hypothetical protein|nr:carbohydrate-binding domain-containing protein [Clostridiales Family XIII bacterium]